MALSHQLVFSALALSVVVLAGPGGRHGGGHGGHGGPGGPPFLPPFLQNVTSEGRQAFFDIVSNGNLTISEIETQINSWAQTYGVSDQVNAFQANLTATMNEIKQNVSAVVANLPTVQTQLNAIFENKDQTSRQMFEAVGELKKQYPQEVEVLFFLSKSLGKFHGGFPGGRGGFGGFPGNQGGFPGNQGGFPGNQGGFPGNQGGFPGNQRGFPGNQGGFPGNQGGFPGFGGQNQGGFGGFGGQSNQGNFRGRF